MNKAFPLWLWEDTPSINTPLAKRLLNLINNALSIVDDRVISHDTTKANQTDMLTAITGVSLDEDTGIFTFTRHNGTTVTIDTRLEKVIMNWNFDSETQTLYLILQDGTEMPVDLSAFITNVEFADSTTIRAVIGTDGKVAFEIIDGSITGSKLEPNYLANAQMAADSASQSATSAEESAVRAESAAERAEGIAGGDFATNKRVDDIVNGTTQVGDSKNLDGHGADYFAKSTDLANYLPYANTTKNSTALAQSTAIDTYHRVNNSLAMIDLLASYDGRMGLYDRTHGKFMIQADTSGNVTVNGTASGNLPLDSKGILKKFNDTSMGGRLSFEKPTTETDLQANVAVDVYMNQMRFIELGGSVRGAFLDFTKCGASGTSEIHHDGNSAKVVVSASAPSDTSAIWIDTTNKLVKAYIDGAWTVI